MIVKVVRGQSAEAMQCAALVRNGVLALYVPEDEITQETAEALGDVLSSLNLRLTPEAIPAQPAPLGVAG